MVRQISILEILCLQLQCQMSLHHGAKTPRLGNTYLSLQGRYALDRENPNIFSNRGCFHYDALLSVSPQD